MDGKDVLDHKLGDGRRALMPKCMKVDCQNPATKALKLTFYNESGESVTAYVALVVCDEIHMPDAEVVEFYKMNFETLCLCMEQVGEIGPDVELTKSEWASIEEAEKNWGDAIEHAKKSLK